MLFLRCAFAAIGLVSVPDQVRKSFVVWSSPVMVGMRAGFTPAAAADWPAP